MRENIQYTVDLLPDALEKNDECIAAQAIMSKFYPACGSVKSDGFFVSLEFDDPEAALSLITEMCEHFNIEAKTVLLPTCRNACSYTQI